MCYKHMWDNLVTDEFPTEQFYNSFPLNRYCTLSSNVREYAAESGIPVEVRYILLFCFPCNLDYTDSLGIPFPF